MSALLLAAVLLEPPRRADAPALAAWNFEPSEDRDFDRWPDGWTRRRGPGFPHVVPVALHAGALRFEAGGAAAAAYSPPIDLPPGAAVRLTGRVRCEALHGDAAALSLSLIDSGGRRVARFLSDPATGDDARALAVGPVPPAAGAVRAVVGVHLVPGTDAGMSGAFLLEEVALTAEPHLSVALDPPGAVAAVGRSVGVTVTVGGLPAGPAGVAASVRVIPPRGESAELPVSLAASGGTAAGGTRADLPASGLWTFTATLPHRGRTLTRTVTAVAADFGDDSNADAAPSRVGWTLRAAPRLPEVAQISDAAAAGGAGRVRWAVAAGGTGAAASDAAFARALRARGVRPVGVLTAAAFGGRPGEGLPDVLAARADAADAVAAVVAPLAAHVRHWQLGADAEPAPLAPPGRPTVAGLVRAAAAGVLTAGPPHTGADVPVVAGDAPGPAAAWRVVGPEADPGRLSRSLVAALAAGAGPAFLPDAADPAAGLLSDAGPTARFAAARTAATLVGGGRFLGDVAVPGGNGRTETAAAFDTAGGVVLVPAADRIGRTTMRLGGAPVRRDWDGTAVPLNADPGGRHPLSWGPTPAFVTGADGELVRFRLGVELADGGALRSAAGPQPLVVRCVNPFGVPVSATVTPDVPAGWRVEPTAAAIALAPGSAGAAAFTLRLPPHVSLGPHPVAVAVRLTGGPGGELTVPRTARVRLAGLRLTVADRPLPGGGWEVTQTLAHALPGGESPSFRCDLLAAGVPRVSRAAGPLPAGSHALSFRLPASAAAGDAVWLRVSEVGGDRVLNRRWPLGSPPAD